MAEMCRHEGWDNVTAKLWNILFAGMIIEGVALGFSLIGLFGTCTKNDWCVITDTGIACLIMIPITVQMIYCIVRGWSDKVKSC